MTSLAYSDIEPAEPERQRLPDSLEGAQRALQQRERDPRLYFELILRHRDPQHGDAEQLAALCGPDRMNLTPGQLADDAQAADFARELEGRIKSLREEVEQADKAEDVARAKLQGVWANLKRMLGADVTPGGERFGKEEDAAKAALQLFLHLRTSLRNAEEQLRQHRSRYPRVFNFWPAI